LTHLKRFLNWNVDKTGGDVMQSTIDAFEKAHSVPQIQKDRLGRYQFLPVHKGLKDCCGFVYRIFGRSVKW
jgi:hypothetical protein